MVGSEENYKFDLGVIGLTCLLLISKASVKYIINISVSIIASVLSQGHAKVNTSNKMISSPLCLSYCLNRLFNASVF